MGSATYTIMARIFGRDEAIVAGIHGYDHAEQLAAHMRCATGHRTWLREDRPLRASAEVIPATGIEIVPA